MPGLDCNFRIEEVQECDSLIDAFESDDADNDSLNDDISLEDSDYSNNTFDYGESSEESESSEEESSDDGSDAQSESRKSNDQSTYHLDFVAQELSRMSKEQCELAQNLIAAILHEGAMMFNYYIKLVPTIIEKADGHILYTNQFSVTKFEKHLSITEGDSGMPGIFFSYELSPLMVKRTQQRKSIGHLIMTLLSYVSGVYIAALLIDSCVHRTVLYLRKWEIGKQS